MRILSVDRGDVRTGLAVCDVLETLASPVTVITEYHPERLAGRVAKEAERLSAEAIVVGLPRNMDGTLGQSADKCQALAEELKALTGLPVTLWDERLTTVAAHNILSAGNVRGKKRKETVDSVAAVLILEGYLASRKHQRKDSLSCSDN